MAKKATTAKKRGGTEIIGAGKGKPAVEKPVDESNAVGEPEVSGQLQIFGGPAVGYRISVKHGEVVVRFGKPVQEIGLSRAGAVELADLLRVYAKHLGDHAKA